MQRQTLLVALARMPVAMSHDTLDDRQDVMLDTSDIIQDDKMSDAIHICCAVLLQATMKHETVPALRIIQ